MKFFVYVSSSTTGLVVDLHIKEKHVVTLVHDSRKTAASESSDVPGQEWAIGSDRLECLPEIHSMGGGRTDEIPGCPLEQGILQTTQAGELCLSGVGQANVPKPS